MTGYAIKLVATSLAACSCSGSNTGTPHQELDRGAEVIRRLVPSLAGVFFPGRFPRMYVVTRGAQQVLADICVNLEQGGLRGLRIDRRRAPSPACCRSTWTNRPVPSSWHANCVGK